MGNTPYTFFCTKCRQAGRHARGKGSARSVRLTGRSRSAISKARREAARSSTTAHEYTCNDCTPSAVVRIVLAYAYAFTLGSFALRYFSTGDGVRAALLTKVLAVVISTIAVYGVARVLLVHRRDAS